MTRTIRRTRSRSVDKLPLALVVGFIFCEYISLLVPDSVSDEVYKDIYFFFEDLSTVFLAAAFYFALSYTSVVMKGVSFSLIIVTISIMVSNILTDFELVSRSFALAISFVLIMIPLQLFMTRFIFRLKDGEIGPPDADTIYLIVNKPHNFTGLLGLIWSGIGGGVSAYVNGDCYWFSRDEDVLIKSHDPDWYKGKRMINCGTASPEKIADLESLIGQKWSLWNNCFTVFSSWQRRWT